MHDSKVKPLDSVWLMMESSDTPMHVGVMAVFQKPRQPGRHFIAELAQRMRQAPAVAPWNCRLGRRPGASVVEDKQFDLDYHFRRIALPEPGGERELGQVVSQLHSQALDLSRPLWEFHLIEGLERDRFAFYIKLHHALVSGINGVPAVLDHLSTSARARNLLPLWSQPLEQDERQSDLTELWRKTSLTQSMKAAGTLGKAAYDTLRGTLRPGGDTTFVLPRGTPRSTLNRRINHHRRIATQQVSQSRVQAVARATDSTANEILTYLCGTSLRRFFKEYNALPDESLIGMLPVSLKERGQHISGNAIAGIRVPLHTHVGEPLERLAAIRDSMQSVRSDRASLPEAAVTSYVMLRAAPVYASQLPGLGQLVPPLFNLAVSNVNGSDKHRYFDGARLEAIYPVNQLMQFTALSIDCVDYAGTYNIGFTGARDTLPHLQRLAVYFGRALDELEELIALEAAQ